MLNYLSLDLFDLAFRREKPLKLVRKRSIDFLEEESEVCHSGALSKDRTLDEAGVCGPEAGKGVAVLRRKRS